MFKRNHRMSDTDLRGRRSLDALGALSQSRSSEHIPRNPIHVESSNNPRLQSSVFESSNNIDNLDCSQSHRTVPRFSPLRFKNASDRLNVPDQNPQPQSTPLIITTAPPSDVIAASNVLSSKRMGSLRLWRNYERLQLSSQSTQSASQRSSLSTRRKLVLSSNNSTMRVSRVTFDEPDCLKSSSTSSSLLAMDPLSYHDNNSSLPLDGCRLSESSRSTGSSADQTIAYHTTSTTHTTTTTTTFFRLPRRRKKDTPLFPLPNRPSGVSSSHSDRGPRRTARRHSMISVRSQPGSESLPLDESDVTSKPTSSPLNFTGPSVASLQLNLTTASGLGDLNSVPLNPPAHKANSLRCRGRSSTVSSIDQYGDGRITGRNSFGGLFLSRMRRDSESLFSAGVMSRSSSPQPHLALSTSMSGKLSHDISIPERNDEDTPPIYLSRLFQAISKSVVASLLARNADPFHLAVLKAYMETFNFSDDPMDMALRKLLMEVELPSETQQIDRVLQAFADRYHECNPFIYKDSDQAYYVAFSLIMLHTDFFNKNNKHKMQKADYVKNTLRAIDQEGISKDILECFYSNIIYTPFIRLEDEFDINGQKIVPHRPKKSIFHRAVNSHDGRRIREPIDPYLLIIENRLDILRASLKDVVQFEDPYSYSGTASRLDMMALHKAFFRSAVLQIVSARSRPEAFMTQQSMENPDGADPGVVEIKVTKVGLLWRKELKRKKARRPWQEWGAVLTGSKLYFFRNIAWIKSLLYQYEQHHKHGFGTPVIFKPALEQFKPDAQISTDDAVALLDKSYKKHKNAFAFVRHGGIQEYFIADSEADMNDWLAKLNYAATFRTAGVRMRGVVGGANEGQQARAIRPTKGTSGSHSAHSILTSTGEISITPGVIDIKLAGEIAAARKEVVEQRIFDSEDKIAVANKDLQNYLRSGRHLTILTPIQPRTREQVVLAAATLAAKLKWVRMEMWKLRCHRDILALDLEEERRSTREQVQTALAATAPNLIARKTPIPCTTGFRTVDINSGGQTLTQGNFSQLSSEQPHHVMTHTLQAQNQNKIPSGEQSGSIIFDHTGLESLISVTPISTTSSTIGGPPGWDDWSISTTHSQRSTSPTRSQSSVGVSVDYDRVGEDDVESGKDIDKGNGTEKDVCRPTVRRSLQRTLRETQTVSHRRGKSNCDDASTPEKKHAEDEGLSRVAGSFTVHGKKASVITFGSEWQNMSSEDRLKRHKGIQADSNVGTHQETETSPSILSYSRLGSQAVVAVKRDDDLEQAVPPYSNPGSPRTEELLEVLEGRTNEVTLLLNFNGITTERPISAGSAAQCIEN